MPDVPIVYSNWSILKLKENLPEVLFYILIANIALFVIGGIWHYFIGVLFDFKYVEAVQNFGAVFSLVAIVLIMRYFLYEIYVVFKNSLIIHFRQILISICCFISVFLAYTFVIFILNHNDQINVSFERFTSGQLIDFLFVFFSIQLVLIITEEVIFRGFLLNVAIYKTKNTIISVLIISLAFSLSHIHYDSLISFVIAFIFGIIASLLYLKTKSIYPSIFLHVGWNFSNNFFMIKENEITNIDYNGTLIPNSIRILALMLITIIPIVGCRKKIVVTIKQFFNTNLN